MARARTEVFLDKERGMWVGRFWRLRQPGKRPPKQDLLKDHPGLDEYEVDLAFRQAERKLIEKIFGDPNAQPEVFSQNAERWLAGLPATVAPKTVVEYERAIRTWLKINGDHSLTHFGAAANTRFIQKRLEEGVSDATIQKDQRSLQVFANYLFQEGIIPKPIFLKKRKVEKKLPDLYTEAELNRLEERLAGNQDWLRIFWLARYAVLRAGEIWSLPLQRIDLKRGVISIADTPTLEWTVKTRQQRKIPIGRRLFPLLEEDLKQRKSGEIWWLDSGSGYPRYANPGMLTQVFRRRCRELGIDGPKPLHGIRAAGITRMLLDSGGQAERVAQIAGHSVAVMLTHYARITEEDSRDVVDLL